MKYRIFQKMPFLLVSCFLLSCNNNTELNEINKFYKEFWVQTDKGHAKNYYVQISLPRSYYKEESKKYPVIYLTDADWCFNIARDLTIVLGWPQREVIVVGIGYGSPEKLSELRWPEYSDTLDEFGKRGWIQFLDFIENKLIPKVESEYRINSYNRTLFGWSWGVLFVTNVIEYSPLLFNNYIIGGGWRDSLYIEDLYNKWPALPINIYFGTGESDFNCQKMLQFADRISSKNFYGLQTIREIYPHLAHEVLTMGVLIDRGMKWIYLRKPIEPKLQLAMQKGGVEEVINEYERLHTTNPEDYEFDPDYLISFAKSLRNLGSSTAKDEILNYVETNYPIRKVTIQVYPKVMPEFDYIYITGNNPSLGDWNPKIAKLKQMETGKWEGNFKLRAGTNLEFKITRGSWETEAVDSTGAILKNYSVSIDSDTMIIKVVENWMDTK